MDNRSVLAPVRGSLPQPLIAIAASAMALSLVVGAWAQTVVQAGISQPRSVVLLGLGLTAALALTRQFGIPIRTDARMYMGSIVMYLMAVLLPPVIAITGVAVGMTIGELSVCGRCGNRRSAVATQIARWIIIVTCGSLLAHVPAGPSSPHVLALCGTGVLLWAGDVLTAPLVFVAHVEEDPKALILSLLKSAGISEATQYIVALIAALVALHAAWTLVLFAALTAILYVALKYRDEIVRQAQVAAALLWSAMALRRRKQSDAEAIARALEKGSRSLAIAVRLLPDEIREETYLSIVDVLYRETAQVTSERDVARVTVRLAEGIVKISLDWRSSKPPTLIPPLQVLARSLIAVVTIGSAAMTILTGWVQLTHGHPSSLQLALFLISLLGIVALATWKASGMSNDQGDDTPDCT